MTSLASYIRKIAEKKADESGFNFAPAECYGLVCLMIVSDKELLSGEEYDEAEYKKLCEKIGKYATDEDIRRIDDLVTHKEYSDNDKQITRTLIRKASIENVNAVDVWDYVIENTDFAGFLDDAEGLSDTDMEQFPDFSESIQTHKDNESDDDNETAGQDEVTTLSELIKTCNEIRDELINKVYGQDFAIKQFVEGIFRGEMNHLVNPSHKGPRAIFLFAGSPGVGKTFLAGIGAEKIGRKFKRFDMSRYGDSTTVSNFSGISKEYKDSKAGEVTSFVEKNPTSVILFDEIEKAYRSIIIQFLQILDIGKLEDAYTLKEVDFTNTIIIFTTNAGKQLYADKSKKKLSATPKNVIIDCLEKDINPITHEPYFPEAICSRLATGNVIMFNHLSAGNLMKITSNKLNELRDNVSQKFNIKFNFSNPIVPSILYSLGGSADGRNTSAATEIFFYSELQELLRI